MFNEKVGCDQSPKLRQTLVTNVSVFKNKNNTKNSWNYFEVPTSNTSRSYYKRLRI